MNGSSVYLIGPEVGPLKVGVSGRPDVRAMQLQTAHPRRVSVFGSWYHVNARAVEAKAHNLLAPWRMTGEWFDVSKDRAVVAIEQAIAIVNGRGDAESFGLWTPHTRRAILDTEVDKSILRHAPLVWKKDEFRLGYARHSEAPALSLDYQIAWLEASHVDPRDIWVETDRTANFALMGAIKDFREDDRFLVLSPDVIACSEWLMQLTEAALKTSGILQFAAPI